MITEGKWRVLIPASGTYALFAMQFLVPTNLAFQTICKILALIRLEPSPSVDKPLFVALFLFFPYILVIWGFTSIFDNFVRKFSISRRIKKFNERIEAIDKYHNKNQIIDIIDAILSVDPQPRNPLCRHMIMIMLDLLITDIRDAFQYLCARDDIRVAVFVEMKKDIGEGRTETVLSMIASTEFDKNYEQSTFFRKPFNQKRYEGFCGAAWSENRPQSGAFRSANFVSKDARFLLYNPKDKTRSFLCLPVGDGELDNSPPMAVLSIDSGSSLDFHLTDDLRRSINFACKPSFKHCKNYVELLQLT